MWVLVGDAHIQLDHLLQHLWVLSLLLLFDLLHGGLFLERVLVAVTVVLVDQSLEVSDFDQLAAIFLAFDERVHLHRIVGIRRQQLLNHLVLK